MVTFVCHLCGAPGTAPAPGVARCERCGHLAFVDAGTSVDGAATPAADRRAPAQRLATLWVRPNPEETAPEPVREPVRRARRPVLAAALLGGTALAVAAAVVVAPRLLRTAASGSDAPRVADAPSAPVAVPDPPAPLPAPARAPARERPAPALREKASRAAPPRRVASTARDGAAAPRAAALVNPAPVDRRCIPRALRARRDVRLPDEIAVRFAVAANGTVGPIEVLGGAKDRDASRAIEDAIRSCPFTPGEDEGGRPVALPVLMRIRFAPAGAQAGF